MSSEDFAVIMLELESSGSWKWVSFLDLHARQALIDRRLHSGLIAIMKVKEFKKSPNFNLPVALLKFVGKRHIHIKSPYVRGFP